MADAETRIWLRRVALSLLIGLAIGLIAWLAARGILGVLLFAREQQLLADLAGALSGGIEGLAGSNLRAIRLRVQALAAEYDRISLLVGLAAGGISWLLAYIRAEREPKTELNSH